MLNDFISLFFPNYCLACNRGLAKGEKLLCLKCEYSLPKTDSHLNHDNFIASKFYGRAKLLHAVARYKFNKSGKVQRLLHRLKYDNKPELGTLIGAEYGKELMKAEFDRHYDVIVPVPLHKRKLRRRGYNQSAMFGQGLSESMELPQFEDALIRNIYTSTQTKKSRLDRLKNVDTIFTHNEDLSLDGLRVLLVDDVITTGATLEACIEALTAAGTTSVGVAAIASAV
ncbi:ComF family protein [Fulvivirga sediminis]|uniref:ComF family protein n=1 Tax=Fulvivirga sediminis TaxID=2803949 RepID=A0A937F5T0_9BACT|nr:phosphoribosyltransferase family protein [Fulvivirga sediminis]MBL3654543.1 ComF family protein [Fulvivirga sediminis]